jgi:cell division septum initiation protein DivIVA
VHGDHSGRTIKIWLDTLKVAYNDGYPMREVTALLDIVDRNRERLLEAWREYFDH